MTPDLESALAECDNLGVMIRLESGKVKIRGEVSLPASVLDQLRAHRAELVKLLEDEQRPVADPVLFVSLRLEVLEVPGYLAQTTPVVYVSRRAFYRVSPRVLFYLAEAINRRAERNLDGKADVYRQASNTWLDLYSWVINHYRPDQVSRAIRGERSLPTIPALGGEAKSFEYGQTSANAGKQDTKAAA